MWPQRPQIEPLPAKQHGITVTAFEKPCVDSHWHFHPEVELVWIEQGQGVLHVGQALFPYRPGLMILAGSNLPHAYGSHPSQRTGAKWHVLHLPLDAWGEAFWRLPENHRIQKLITQSLRGIVFSGDVVATCAGLLRRMESRQPGDMPLALALELLERLALAKNRHTLNAKSADSGNGVTGNNGGNSDPRLIRILAWLDERADDADISQAEAAQLAGMTPQAFCRFFRRLTGYAFHEHLNNLRVARACAALLCTDKAVAEIAFETGFGNLSNFNRRFREIVGHTPREYRDANGGFAGK